MEKKFILAGKKVYTSQIITVIAVVLFYGFYILQPDLGCQRSVNEGGGVAKTFFIVFGVFLMFGGFLWLTAMKHFKQGGSLLFNAHELKIVKDDVTEIIPVEMTTGIRLVYHGIEGEPKASPGLLGVLGYNTTTDGSGNLLQFRFNDLDYNLNLVFESKEDFNAIGHLFREIERVHGIRPEVIEEDEE